MAKYLVFFGPPGVGKGTSAAAFSKSLGFLHVSTGDLLRKNITAGTKLGGTAKNYMDKGALVPDAITIAMLREHLDGFGGKGAILDGFPRTEKQADALEKMLITFKGKIAGVFSLEAPTEELVIRLSGRLTCSNTATPCGEIYNTRTKPPKISGICDRCGSELIQRDDDKPAAIKKRIEVFMSETAPVPEYYRTRGLLWRINGANSTEQVQYDLNLAINYALS